METDMRQNDTNTLRDYLKILFRHKSVIIIAFVTVMVTVFVGLKLKTPSYEARVKMLISAEKQVEVSYYRGLGGYSKGEMVLTQSEIVKSNPVIERAVEAARLYQRPLDYEKNFASPLKAGLIALGAKKLNKKLASLNDGQRKAFLYRMAVEDLKRSIEVNPIRDTNLFTITVKEFSPVGAAVIANVVSRSYVIFDLEQQLAEIQLKYGEKHLSVMQMKDNIERIEKTLTGEPISNIEAFGPASVKIIEQAQIPLEPSGSSKKLTFILALFMSPFLGIMLAFGFEYMDQTIKSPQEIETFLNIPFLGDIPKKKKDKKKALHKLSDQVYMLMKSKGFKSLLLTSVLKKEGSTSIVANLASHLSKEMGHKVLLIDANLREPQLHKAFKVSDNVGLEDVLEGKSSLEEAVQSVGSNLTILTSKKTKSNPTTLLGSSKMEEMIKTAKQKYELILVDCVNLKDFSDSTVISSYLDGTCLVINEGKTRRQVVKNAISPLEKKDNNLVGVILNNRTFVLPKVIYERI